MEVLWTSDFCTCMHLLTCNYGTSDGTSLQLRRWLANYNLVEVEGSHRNCFTFHHLSKPERKSQIDQIYTNLNLTNLKGFSQPCTVSDHYLVGVYALPPADLGPKQWQFPVDILENPNFQMQVGLILDNFDQKVPCGSWEQIKIKIQNLAQQYTQFRKHQL